MAEADGLNEETPDQPEISDSTEVEAPKIDKKEGMRRGKAAAAMLIAGASLAEIAERLDYVTPEHARDAAYRVIGDAYRPGIDYAAYQSLAAARLEAVIKASAPLAQTRYLEETDPKTGKKIKVRNEDQFVAMREFRAATNDWIKLYGLQAPTRLEIQTPGAMELAAVVGSLVEAARGPQAIEGDIFADVIEDDEGEENA